MHMRFMGLLHCRIQKEGKLGPLNAYVRTIIIDFYIYIISIYNKVTNTGLDLRFSMHDFCL